MKKILSVLLAFCMLITLLASCSKNDYRNDVDPDTLIKSGLEALSDDVTYLDPDDDFLDEYFKEPEWVEESEIRLSSIAINLNQVGIYHVEAGHANEMKELLSAYLAKSLEQNGAYYDSYMPEETLKLKDAEVKIFGNYVVYAILNTTDRATFFDSVEAGLKKA